MSGANAISGIILIGGIIQLLTAAPSETFVIISATIAILIGTINVSGGFFVTHRMLSMFAKKKTKK
jgi:NAD(P) transhydrogenase subunit alpha